MDAAQLLLQAGSMGKGCDAFVLDMGRRVRIADLADRMISLMGDGRVCTPDDCTASARRSPAWLIVAALVSSTAMGLASWGKMRTTLGPVWIGAAICNRSVKGAWKFRPTSVELDSGFAIARGLMRISPGVSEKSQCNEHKVLGQFEPRQRLRVDIRSKL